MREFHVLSLGAGVQSTTVFLAMREGLLTVPSDTVAIFADTQEEPSAVYSHLEWLKSLEWPRIIITTIGKLGDDLINGVNTTGQRNPAAIPAYTSNGGRTIRQCSKEYKTQPLGKAIRRQVVGLAPKRGLPKNVTVHQYFGISRDEARRSVSIKERVESTPRWIAHFPLIEIGWTRADCLRYLADKVPHPVIRSACVFCPYRSDREFLLLKREHPADWARAVEIDAALRNGKAASARRMKNAMFVHRSGVPLSDANLNENQTDLGFVTECEGMCGV